MNASVIKLDSYTIWGIITVWSALSQISITTHFKVYIAQSDLCMYFTPRS